ncbi:MAG TPA: site-specific integrase [Acidimicrobiales bacterium]|nr:site-specific integrase [Acidimicrobiales bacterium]
MSSIRRDASGAWRARYRDPNGHQRSRNFARKIDADQFLTGIEHSKLLGAYVDPAAGRTTFREYAEQWRAVQVHRPSTAAQVETNLRRHVLPHLGDRPLAAIRPSEIQAWVRGRSGVLKPPTVELLYRYVVAILRAAVADRLIATSPAVGIKLPKAEVHRVVPLETAVVEKLIAAVPDRYRSLVVLAAGTGMRQGECFGLTVDRVDFLRRQVTVDRQLMLLPGAGPVLAPPKTQASYRVIPLPRVVVDALAAHIAQNPVGPLGFLFTNSDGDPIRRTRFSDEWRPAVKAAGAPAGTGFHALRHYYASLLIRHGESVKVVQARLGHASATETLDTYSHLWPDSEDQTRAAVDHVLLAAVSDLCQTVDTEP